MSQIIEFEEWRARRNPNLGRTRDGVPDDQGRRLSGFSGWVPLVVSGYMQHGWFLDEILHC